MVNRHTYRNVVTTLIPYLEFFYGMSTNYKIEPDVKKIKHTLLQQSLDRIIGLSLDKNEDTKTITLHFPTDDMITITQLTRPEDVYCRDGVDNHTIILKTSDYINHYPPINLVKHLLEKEKP